jgi:group I intron endonuclease
MGIIYHITFPDSSRKGYVGKTEKSLFYRIRGHKYDARYGSPLPIHRAIRKYGEESMKVVVLAKEEDPEFLNFLEMHYIREMQTMTPNGYNLTKGGEGSPGMVHSRETVERLVKLRTGQKRTEATKKRMSLARIGMKFSESHKENLSRALSGNKIWVGKVHTQASKEKMSLSQKKRFEREKKEKKWA